MSGRLRALIERLIPSGGTAEKAVKSAIWAMGQNAFGRGLQLAMLVVVARLVGPEEIGLVGIALLVLSGVKKFTNIGLNDALVQQAEENVDEHLNTVWVLEIARGVLIFVVLFFAAPIVGEMVFSEPRATDLIRAIGVSPLILGFRNPAMVYFQKSLDFHKEFVYRVGGSIAQVGVAIGYALIWPSAWALVFGYIAKDLGRCIASYAMDSFRPQLKFKRDSARDLVNYGKWITGSSILFFLYSEGDDAFIGWLIGPAALAFYQYGYRFSNAPATELGNVISSVMFPALSQVQEDSELLRQGFLRTIRVTSFVAAPVSVGIAVVAPDFVMTLFGPDWMQMVVPMQILSIYGFLRALGKTFGPVWKTLNRPDLVTKLSGLRVVLLAALIWPVTDMYGIAGTAALVTGIYIFPMMPLDLYVTVDMIDVKYREIVREIAYPVVASVAMGGVVWYVDSMLSFGSGVELAVSVLVGAAAYSAIVLLLDQQSSWGITGNIRGIVANARR